MQSIGQRKDRYIKKTRGNYVKKYKNGKLAPEPLL